MSGQRHSKIGLHTDDSGLQHHESHGVIVRRAKTATIIFLLLLLVGTGATVIARVLHNQKLAGVTEENAHVYVTTIHADGGAKADTIILPSTLQGIIEAPIYARSSGYVLSWAKDIGSKVGKGDVLAEIDTPEVDAQLAQAIATRAQQAASLELAKSSAQRWEELRKKDAVTEQELNERRSAYAQAEANLAAADADVQRLKKLTHFKKIIAPFSGVITRRDVEVGDLVDAGNSGTGHALFTLAKVNPIRLYVYLPQVYSQRVQIGDPVSVVQTDHPDQILQGKVKHIAGAIDPTTRTLQIEINLPNQDNNLMAGAYVQVTVTPNGRTSVLRVPTNVLLFRPVGTQVAVVDNTGRVKMHTVIVGHDLGNTVEILGGITADDNLILNPADSLADNDIVTVPKPEPAGKAHS